MSPGKPSRCTESDGTFTPLTPKKCDTPKVEKKCGTSHILRGSQTKDRQERVFCEWMIDGCGEVARVG